MNRSSSPAGVHPIVKAAAAVLVVGAAGVGIWAGSFGGPPRPQPVEPSIDRAELLPTGDTITSSLDAEHGAAVFEQRCARCHTVGGGDREGPDLAGAALRRDPSWLRAMVAAPDSMFKADSLARWVLEVHDIPPENATRDHPDLQALAAYFATFDLGR